MTEELKQKAEAEADKVIIGSGMDRASVIHLKHLLVTMYMQGATENGVQWHKVADNLPMNEGWVCNQYGIPCRYDWENEQWLDWEGTTLRVTEWCDMPYKE